MSGNLRQRSHTRTPEPVGNKSVQHVALTLESMLSSSPQHNGIVMKLHIPVLYSILPKMLRDCIKSVATAFGTLSWTYPQWKQRNLVLLGSFLYKFSSSSDKPKGSPLPIASLEIELWNDFESTNLFLDYGIELPNDYSGIFCISNIRKRTFFACSNMDEAQTWVNALHQAQHEAITRSMGHASRDSYPLEWDAFDRLGRSLMESKERINRSIETKSLRETELIDLAGGISRGVYG